MKIDTDKLRDFDHARSLEWIETNGLGGWASSTVSGAHSRRYHGLLVAAINPPVGRAVILSKLDEAILEGNERFELGTNLYPGAVHPQGYTYLQSFERNLFPEFHFKAGSVELKKTIATVHGESTTLVLYEVLKADGKFILELQPFQAGRDYHGLSHANDAISRRFLFADGIFKTRNYEGLPEFFISVPGSEFKEQQQWYYNFEYAVEQYRGLDFQEDLFTQGRFSVALEKGSKLGIIISTEDPSGRDAFKLFLKEKERREDIVQDFAWSDDLKQLTLAADQFIVKRGEDLKTIIAGYHWFGDWGRDTMIALPGICLVTGRYEDAKKILKAFAESVSQGMLPNRFPDYGETPEYNTIDATLWFFHAIYKYYQYTQDKSFVLSVLPVLKDIIDWHYKGTRYNIHVDQDELIYGGQDGVQLTWMDAKVGDWVVTPRKGKAVEINALWYNALCVMDHLHLEFGNEEESQAYHEKAGKVRQNFIDLFWNEQQNCLYDYVDGDHKNDDLRPNQIYAVSLPFSLLDKEKAKRVFQTVENYLLTPRGLRSLAQFHKDYHPVYGGGVWSRDSAYHQGTVWSFLIGPFIDALIQVEGERGKAEASRIIRTFLTHLQEAGVGTISEIFDADPPHQPRGCMAQAWGVGEVLRVAVEHDLFLSPVNFKKTKAVEV